MNNRDVKPLQAKLMITKPARTKQKTSPRKSAKVPLNTAVNDVVRDQRDGEDRVPPQKSDDDRIQCQTEQSNDRITPSNKKTRNKRRPLQKPYAEICAFDDTNEITFVQ